MTAVCDTWHQMAPDDTAPCLASQYFKARSGTLGFLLTATEKPDAFLAVSAMGTQKHPEPVFCFRCLG